MLWNNQTKIFLGLGGIVVIGVLFWTGKLVIRKAEKKVYLENVATIASAVRSPFEYTFNVDGTLAETGTFFESVSPYWWVDSGGLLIIHTGIGSTIQGDLPSSNKWRTTYAKTNSIDTDNGLHPQNIFRLLTRSTWHNFREEMYFRVNKSNMSDSPNRNESNGLLLFSRYTDSADLYYAGIRVDGHAIIKKKLKGTYYTLAEVPLFAGTYDRAAYQNFLPQNVWIGLRSEIMTVAPDHVKIRLYVDVGETGRSADRSDGANWRLVAEADDESSDSSGNRSIIDARGYAGVRTDFMDVDFKNYKIEEL